MNHTTSRNPTPARPPGVRHHGGLRPFDRRRITEWIGDAFAVLCVRVSGYSRAEKHLRLGFEAILRQLGTSPLGAITKSPLPPYAPPSARASDLRLIIKALDSCLTIFNRYGAALNSSYQKLEVLVQTTRRFAEEALHTHRPPPSRRRTMTTLADIETVRSAEIARARPAEITTFNHSLHPITLSSVTVAPRETTPVIQDVAMPTDGGVNRINPQPAEIISRIVGASIA